MVLGFTTATDTNSQRASVALKKHSNKHSGLRTFTELLLITNNRLPSLSVQLTGGLEAVCVCARVCGLGSKGWFHSRDPFIK